MIYVEVILRIYYYYYVNMLYTATVIYIANSDITRGEASFLVFILFETALTDNYHYTCLQ